MSQQYRPRRVLAATGVAAALVLGAGAGAQAAPAASTSSASSTLAKIRYCESGNNYSAQNARSTASGAYQFLDSTWRGLSAAQGYSRAKYAPASVQDAAARELYAQAGTSPWAASQSCWSRLGTVPSTSSSSPAPSSSSTASAASATSATSAASARQTATAASRSTTRKAPTASARHTAARKAPKAKAAKGRAIKPRRAKDASTHRAPRHAHRPAPAAH